MSRLPRHDELVNLSAGDVEVVLRPGLGGRIWDIRFRGVSLLFQNPDLLDSDPATPDLTELPTRTPQFPFPLWGGEKTWIAPQTAWPSSAPHRALDCGAYELMGQSDRASMRSAPCPDTGLQIMREVMVTGESAFRLTQTVRNAGDRSLCAAPWSVMMLKRPVTVWFASPATSGIEFVLGTPFDALTTAGGLSSVHCSDQGEFKLAIVPPRPMAVCELGGVRIVATASVDPQSLPRAPGHGVMEIYNSQAYAYGELEWLGPCKMLGPGEATHLELDFKVVASVPGAASATAHFLEGPEE